MQLSRGNLMKRQPKKYAANWQESTHTELRPQQSPRAALLRLHSNVGAHPQIHTHVPQNTLPQDHPPKEYIRVGLKTQINLEK